MKSLISYVATKTKAINGKYHRFLERNFPRFYLLYTTFTKGKNGAETGTGGTGSRAMSEGSSKIICRFCSGNVSWDVLCFTDA